jgi:diguanylate cyclase (GGDEF)-like protein/PAS domain S-box-containing protein
MRAKLSPHERLPANELSFRTKVLADLAAEINLLPELPIYLPNQLPLMMPQWNWIALGGLAVLAIYQQFRVYRIGRESKNREELFQIVTENAADMIALVDVKGRRLYNSPAYRRILGYSPAELSETSAFDQIHADDRFKVLDAAREARSTGFGKKVEYRIRHKDGNWRVLESIAGTIRDEKGDIAKLVIVNRDITERKKAEEQAEHNSFHDPLTGLPNRRLFLDRLQHLFDRAQRNPERQYAVLFVDLDGFKVFNDTLGPALGDQVIVEMGRRIGASLRNEDTIARHHDDLARNAVLSRMGGDEFTILLEGVADSSDAMRAGQRILSVIAEPYPAEGREVRTSASVGIAFNTAAHTRAEELLQEADVAMRRAKALGGSRCEMFDEAMHTRAVNHLKLEAELYQAVVQRQFRIYYQPIVQLNTREIVGFEALLRWQHPTQGLISPYKFMEIAESTGLLVSTSQWMILEVCRQIRDWTTSIPDMKAVGISINVSARQWADARFVTDLDKTLRDTGIDPSQLRFEMTETIAAADPKLTATVLTHLRQRRVGVVLDDFGNGNFSLIALRQLPLEALKIDRSLVTAMLLDRGVSDTLELIILVAHKLNLRVVAKGIESAKQFERLMVLGCDLGQGFLFSQPVEIKAAEQLLRERAPLLNAKVAGGQ